MLNIIQQDLVREAGPEGNRHKVPLIIIDGKGEREFLDDKLLPLIAAAGRLDLRIFDPSRPEISQSNDRPSETKQQRTSADAARLKAQRRYDPPGGRKHIKGGPLEGLLDSINREDIDYGAKLAETRRMFLGGTVENFYFWIIVAEGVTVLILVFYVFWLFRERGNRLEISVDIVTQLANSYLYTRASAVDAIRRHNQLVDEYHAIAEKLARQDATEQTVMTSVVRSSSGDGASEIPSQTATPLSLPESTPNSKPNSSEETAAKSATQTEVSMTKGQLKKVVEDAKRDATLGAKHQGFRLDAAGP